MKTFKCCKNFLITLIFCVGIINFNQAASATEIEFLDLWAKVRENSHPIQKEEHELKATSAAVHRLERHWLPSLGFSGKIFGTNDPGNNLFLNLAQRQVSPSDFDSAQLNNPGNNVFQQYTLGLDLPIYEGGRKSSELRTMKSYELLNTAKKNEALFNEYIEAAKSYSNLSSLQLTQLRLQTLLEKVGALLINYSIGHQSNPVGYSGMLGLRSLKNRTEGALIEIKNLKNTVQWTMSEKARLEYNSWNPKAELLSTFFEKNLPLKDRSSVSISYKEKMAHAKMDAFEKMKESEKSLFLPKIGLFAQEDLTHGSRDTATSFTGGLYLQWSLFSPDNFGRISEKNENYLATVSESAALVQNSNIERNTLEYSEESMAKNLVLLLDSESLLSEQVKVASRLFQSGSLTALQFAELLNRRVDLILNIRQVEQSLIEVRTQRLLLTEPEGLKL